MSKSFTLVACVLLLWVGCSTAPRRGNGKKLPPDWGEVEEVTPAPATNAPAAPPAPAPQFPTNRITETWISLDRWCQMNCLGTPQRISVEPAPTYALTTTGGVMVLRIGSRSASWDGMEFQLGFPPQLIDQQPFIHALDAQKNFLPLLSSQTELIAKTNRVVVIDPGHGGVDTGAKSIFNGGHEKEFTLDWARRLQTLLAENGWKVFLTRTNDLDLSLPDRVAFAERQKADLFVSLHFNSAFPSQGQAGLETYCLTPTGMPSNLTRGFGDDTSLTFPNNAFDAQSLQYAVRLHRALLEANGKMDRGIRRARFLGVLRGQNRPAVLLEGGYLSNPKEARLIADPAYRQKLAEAVARALE